MLFVPYEEKEARRKNKYYTPKAHTNKAQHFDTQKICFTNIFLDAATVSILLVSLFRSSEFLFSTAYELHSCLSYTKTHID